MPKIVMINTVCSGSHGRIMQDLRRAAQADGMDVRIAYGRGADCGGQTLRIGSNAGVLAHVALTRTLDRHAQGSRRATRALVRQLMDDPPDLLHLHNVHGYYLHAQTLFAYIQERRIPTIWTHHDCWAATGHCSHFVRARCGRWRAGCHDCPLKEAYPTSWLVDASRENWRWKRAAFADVESLHLVSPSRWLDGVLAASYLRALPRQVIGNGVDLSLFSPERAAPDDARRRYGIRGDRPLLLAVASPFDARKGFSDALALYERVKGAAQVCLVGLSDKQRRKLPDGMLGIERTEGPEALVSLYAAADCLINPTYEDTYPTVNMEAMACGTPVACYGVGGAPEQLVEPIGRSVPVGDVEALAQAALSLAVQKPALSAPCRAYASVHFDRRVAMEAYLSLYHMMMGV